MALGIVIAPAVLTEWLVLIPVLALEIGAALAAVLVQAMADTRRVVDVQSIVDREVHHDPTTINHTPVVDGRDSAPAPTMAGPAVRGEVRKPAPQRPASKRRGLGHMAVQNRLVDALRDSGGQLSTGTVRGVAALIGASKPPSTMRWPRCSPLAWWSAPVTDWC